MQLISRAHRVRPAEFVEAGSHDAASGLEFALNQQSHGERSRVPAARRQAAEYAVTGGFLIEMKGLRIELGGKALDPIGVDADATGTVGLADGKVLEVRPSKSRPEQGLIKVRTTTWNQDGKAVQVLVSNLVVPRRGTQQAG